MLSFEFIAHILIPAAQAKLIDAYSVCILQISVMPVEETHVSGFHIDEGLILLESLIHCFP
jgi:hypothetical protein